MSGVIEFLCLANSEKHRGRCVAGVRLDTGGWIRPVQTRDGGAIHQSQYTTESGEEVQPLDSVRLHLRRPSPKYHQPENWVISKDTSWELLETELQKPQSIALNAALQRSGEIFRTTENRIAKAELRETFSTQSLTLIQPQDIEFYVNKRDKRSNQPRIRFNFDGHDYDFPITDPNWRNQVSGEQPGVLPTADDINGGQSLLLTISLGEAYEGWCYKIVAALLTVDMDKIVEL